MIMQKPTQSLEFPSILPAGYAARYHNLYGWPEPVVYWSEPYGIDGYEAGEHDGIRDGYFSGTILGYTRFYQPLSDYLDSGKPDPR